MTLSLFFLPIFGCGKDGDLGELPTISSIASEKGKAEGPVTGGTPITIRGSNFSNDAVVFFGEEASPTVSVLNKATLIATSPSIFKTRTVPVSITTGGQFVKRENAFRYTPLIAFSSNRSLTGNFEIFTMAVDGEGKKKITNNALGVQPPPGPTEMNRAPAFSPDGREILFETNRTGDFEIFIMSREGLKPTNLTNHPENDQNPSFSPDGEQIVFVSNRVDVANNPEGDFELFVMDRNGGNLKQLTFNVTDDIAPAFSPDGKQIVFVSKQEIMLINSTGGSPTPLTNDLFDDRDPIFSLDGKQVLFVSNRSGGHEIHAIDTNGNNLIQLTTMQRDISNPALLAPTNNSLELLFSTNKTLNLEIFKMSCLGSATTFITTCDENNTSNLSLHINSDIAPASSP